MEHTTKLTTSTEDLTKAAQYLRDGGLVSFPTETVYGLGASAFDEKAIASIYATKQRPLTDPVIVHVLDFEQALELVRIDDKTKELYGFLTSKFWPGPLTIITPFNEEKLPAILTAQTGQIGIRSPQHSIARKLIELSERPIGAPSANLYGHVSPTTADHVINDFNGKTMMVVDGGKCSFGIESTVIKLSTEENMITILRKGSISEAQIRAHLASDERFAEAQLEAVVRKHVVDVAENAESPGQALKHYSPSLETFLLNLNCQSDQPIVDQEKSFSEIDISSTVLIDFFGSLLSIKNLALNYRDLSQGGNVKEAMANLYDYLRWAENVEGATKVLISNFGDESNSTDRELQNEEFVDTVADKTFRASCGQVLTLDVNTMAFYKQQK